MSIIAGERASIRDPNAKTMGSNTDGGTDVKSPFPFVSFLYTKIFESEYLFWTETENISQILDSSCNWKYNTVVETQCTYIKRF